MGNHNDADELYDIIEGKYKRTYGERHTAYRRVLDDICNAPTIDPGEISDGFHTFNSLYEQRMILFATLVNAFPAMAWKSHRNHNGETPFGGGWFIVGINTPEGPYTYHYEEQNWDIFHCQEVEIAPEWDGHTDKDVRRLLSIVMEGRME